MEGKLRSNKVAGVANRLHLSVPASRDAKERPVCIPQAVLDKRQAAAAAAAQKENAMDEDGDAVPFLIETAGQSKQTMKDLEVANGGAGVFNLDLNSLLIFLQVNSCEYLSVKYSAPQIGQR